MQSLYYINAYIYPHPRLIQLNIKMINFQKENTRRMLKSVYIRSCISGWGV